MTFHNINDVTFFETSPYFSCNSLKQNVISRAPPIPTLPIPKTLQVYSRWPPSNPSPNNAIDVSSNVTGPQTVIIDSLPTSPLSLAPVELLANKTNLRIALKKGICSTRNPHPSYNF